MKICLFHHTIIASGLTWDQSQKICAKILGSKPTEFFHFFVSSDLQGNYSIYAEPKDAAKNFTLNFENWFIEIE